MMPASCCRGRWPLFQATAPAVNSCPPGVRTGYIQLLLLVLLAVPTSGMAQSTRYSLDEERSFFAVITHPAGFAAAFGHSHLITAPSRGAFLRADPEQLEHSAFSVTVPVRQLAVNQPEAVRTLLPELRALGIVESFPQLSAADLRTIHERIVSEEQLAADRHPTIQAHVLSIVEAPHSFNGQLFPLGVRLALEVRGQRVVRVLPARIEPDNGRIKATAVGEFRFSDFGIEPFSAFFGALRNEDRFHLYVSLLAEPTAGNE